MKDILLFWSWKYLGWITEQFGKSSTVLYEKWAQSVGIQPMNVRVRENIVSQIEDELYWKGQAPVSVQANAIADRIARYIPTLFRKG